MYFLYMSGERLYGASVNYNPKLKCLELRKYNPVLTGRIMKGTLVRRRKVVKRRINFVMTIYY